MSERRQQILQAASEIAAERGMSALSVRGVADRAGIGASTLRHYFPNQRALFDAVAGRAFDAQLSDLRIHDRSVPPGERLTECFAQFLPPREGERAALERWLAVYASALGPDRAEPARQLLAVFATRARQRVNAWLDVLAAEGVLRPLDRQRQVTMVMALIDGLCLHLLAPEAGGRVSEVRDVLALAVERLVVVAPAA